MLVRFAASVLLQLTYGHRVTSTAEDQYVKLSELALKGTVESGIPGMMPVDVFPVCQPSLPLFLMFFFPIFFSVLVVKYFPAWLPGMGFKRHAASVRKDVQVMRDTLFEMAKAKMVGLSSTLPN